ncbi:hypothetical protein HRG_013521 [Hirsutella rhossiliensis]
MESNKPADFIFDLPDVDRKDWGIDHDYSFSRKDGSVHFDRPTWDISLQELKKCGENINAKCFDKAKDLLKHNRKGNYDYKAAGHGFVEPARMQLVMGDRKSAELKYINSVIEREKLPYDLGWRGKSYFPDLFDVLDVAVKKVEASEVTQHTRDGTVTDKSSAGYTKPSIEAAIKRLEQDKAVKD